jgi:hypothetical protein
VFGFLIYILQNVTFVGVEIAVGNFEGVQCVAVARHKRDETEVDVDGKTSHDLKQLYIFSVPS